MNDIASPNRPIYLDNQATTPCDPRVLAVMLPYFTEHFANPHSLEHGLGRAIEARVEEARAQVGALIGAAANEIVFTSGATESNNLAIRGAALHAKAMGDPRLRVITLATEHKCVLESVAATAALGFEPVVLGVGADGLLDPAALAEALCTPTLLVSVMAANNETGTIHDIAAIAGAAHAAGALFHTDAAQAAGKIALDVGAMGIDLLSLSGHKIYGPKGIGALYVRRRPRVRLAPLLAGGGQERGLRPGTLPAPLIIGLAEAARLADAEMATEAARIGTLRDALLAALVEAVPDLVVNGSRTARLPGNLNLTFPGAPAQAVMATMADICVSTGSACSSAAIEPSYVLAALGLSQEAASCSLRIGVGRFTSRAEIEHAARALAAAVAATRATSQRATSQTERE